MLNFTFLNDTKIIFGKGVQAHAAQEISCWGKKILIHYGGGHIVHSGLKDQITELLTESGVDYVELGGVKPNPRLGLVNEGIELVRKENIEAILAVGGGSVIDSAKSIAIGSPYAGDVWDFFAGVAEPKNSLPVGVILTIPAAGSESSSGAVLTKEEGWLKRSCGAPFMRPKFALMNPELTYSLPPYATACGIADMMAHIMERYFTNEKEVGFSDHLCEGALRGIMQEAIKVMNNLEDYGARANLMWAGTLAHNDLLGMGRSGDWASHDIEHELSALYDVAHGAGLAIILPAWMKYVYKHDPERFVQFFVRVFGVEQDFYNPERTILEGISRLEEFFQRIGLPTTLETAHIPADRLEEMAKKCTNNDTNKLGSFVPLGKKDVLAIYKLAQS